MRMCVCVCVYEAARRSKVGKNKVAISERALLARINRKVAADGLQVKKSRLGTASNTELGDYYAVDLNRGVVASKHVNLEAWARELEVLADYEQLSQ